MATLHFLADNYVACIQIIVHYLQSFNGSSPFIVFRMQGNHLLGHFKVAAEMEMSSAKRNGRAGKENVDFSPMKAIFAKESVDSKSDAVADQIPSYQVIILCSGTPLLKVDTAQSRVRFWRKSHAS